LGERRKAREKALQCLFEFDLGKTDLSKILERVGRSRLKGEAKNFLKTLLKGTVENLSLIDSKISKLASKWRLERIANVDRNILRLTLYEILFLDDIPPAVSINEAVEIAKKYGTEESSKFVNGILGGLLRSRN